jgi:UDP-glucuronate decarboxylase
MLTYELRTAKEVGQADLDFIVEQLNREFNALASHQLVIAGGAGFLGYYLVQSALHWNAAHPQSDPIRVVVLDNFSRGTPVWLAERSSDPNLTLLKHDITLPLPEQVRNAGYLIHAASVASPTFYRRWPIETMDANVNGLRLLLDFCRERMRLGRPVRGVLFYSSSEVYGDPTPENIPTPETYRGNVSCTGPRACYDESKRYGETLCVNFAQQHGIPVKVARPFNNYGPGLKITDRRVLPDFARDIFSPRNIVMLSDGTARRTFCYVADAVIGYYKVLVRGRAGEAYNIGSEKPEISIAELADMVVSTSRELFGYKGKVIRQRSDDKDYLIDNPNRRCPDLTKARSELAYTPAVPFDEGLRRALVWYADNRTGSDA